jgi:DNA-binding NarL/FixJ family response regulator
MDNEVRLVPPRGAVDKTGVKLASASPLPATSGTASFTPVPLTPRESQVLVLLARRWTNTEIAVYLGIGCRTVETHVYHVLGKLSVPNRRAAGTLAIRLGVV